MPVSISDEGATLFLAGRSNRGKQIVREFGTEWVVDAERAFVLFSDLPGPWYWIRPSGVDSHRRWIRSADDHDLIVVGKSARLLPEPSHRDGQGADLGRFGHNVQVLRRRAGMTQVDLGIQLEMAGYAGGQSGISRMENARPGGATAVRADLLPVLAVALGCRLVDLIEGVFPEEVAA